MGTGIFKITNLIDGKIYVGQTLNYEKRKRRDIKKLNAGVHHNEHLQKAWKELGKVNFSFEFLYECSVDELEYMETAVKRELKSITLGYNLVDGGRKIRKFSPELKRKMSAVLVGRKFSDEHKLNLSLSQRGKIISEESIKKCIATKRIRRPQAGQKNPGALISDKTAAQIILELRDNVDVAVLTTKYEVSKDVIYNLLYNKSYIHILPEIRVEIKNRVARNLEAKKAKVIDLYKSGMSQNKISIKLNMSRNTIREVLESALLDTKAHKNQYVNTEVTNQISKG